VTLPIAEDRHRLRCLRSIHAEVFSMVNMLVEDLEWDAVHQHHLWLSDTFRVMVWDAIGEVLDEEGYGPSVGLPLINRFT